MIDLPTPFQPLIPTPAKVVSNPVPPPFQPLHSTIPYTLWGWNALLEGRSTLPIGGAQRDRTTDLVPKPLAQRPRAIQDTRLPMDPDNRELKPRILALDPAARELLVRFSDAIETAQGKGGDLTHATGYASKAAEQAARIAGVLTLWGDLDAREVQVARPSETVTAQAIDRFPHALSALGHPITWTGRLVTPEAWQHLSGWERHGPDGRTWNNITRNWEYLQ